MNPIPRSIEAPAWLTVRHVAAIPGAAARADAALGQVASADGRPVADRLDAVFSACLDRTAGARDLGAALDLLGQLPALGGSGLVALAGRMEGLVSRLGFAGLRRWLATGVRAYEREPGLLQAYLRGDDGLAARSLAHETEGTRLEHVHDVLQHYLDGFLGAHLKLSGRAPGPVGGPPARPTVSEGGLFLPEGYDVLDGDDGGVLYRAAAAHAVAHLRHSPRRLPARTLKPMAVAVASLVEDARVEHLMMMDCPGLRDVWGRFHRVEGAAARDLSFSGLARRLACALHHEDAADDNFWVNKGVRLFREHRSRATDYAAFRAFASILANDLGQMRVRFLPERHVIEPAYRDDNALLWDFGPTEPPPDAEVFAIESVRLETAPAEPPPQDREAPPLAAAAVETLPSFQYPEWDEGEHLARPDWVTVFERPVPPRRGRPKPPAAPAGEAHRRLFSLSRARRLDRAHRVARQWEGEELDLNAAIAAEVDIRSGLPPDPRVFKRPGWRLVEPAVTLLLDVSESTHDCLPGSFDSLLDIIKAAADALGQHLQATGHAFAIDAFRSNGRADVSYHIVKDFDETFGDIARGRLHALQGGLSTRLGAALRHAHARFRRREFERRILLLVTDGEPADIDVREPRYLAADAAAAVREMAVAGTLCFCLAVDGRAGSYVEQIFGAHHLILDAPRDLVGQLSRAFVRLAAR
ncbi:MAG: VWA domain-containing protein [Rhodocyclaceae bacterium]|nr:VWA domain-containing protein [Rhodocyclaceae bacterium]